MFKEKVGDEITTIIGPSVQVEGNFVANGDIVVEGTVSGSIKTEKNLKIGPAAKVFADVSAANAIIAGEIQGNLVVRENLELASTAKIFGDVKTNLVSIASGACFHGRFSAGEDKRARLEKIEDREKLKPKEKMPVMAEKVKL